MAIAMKKNSYLIIIPAYNEAENIHEVVERAKVHGDVCVIDDASQDETPTILAKQTNIHVIKHEKNTHIAQSILDGMKYALDNHYPYAITMDAGLSHCPEEIAQFKACNDADLVIGARKKKIGVPLHRKLLSQMGNYVYNSSLNFPKSAFRVYYKDIPSGYRRYSKSSMELLTSRSIQSRSFDFLFESVMHIHQANMKIGSVPISYHFTNSSLRPGILLECLRTCLVKKA